ncbi:baseplate J/gp47 family protein [Pelosinus propionicus]|uniref:Uncharacterized phage protein gp47/JayE n=1 Tax=Pelosinus propionicus DSM 13327 TaxID=1123291 RepID=A0A1I4QM28_9FIRM|nr:baseplate J/gp47 family protein [Pelosinus propionicus]SFM40713.1 Uncharacterized phage protein gp47/JayE [Pelosinus propionicus DSM 13327]
MLNFTSYTYDSILADALSRVPTTLDKREGSIIYDALAPVCAELAQAYIEMQNIMTQTYVLTATGTYLDYRVAEAGITRKEAIAAVRIGIFADSNSAAFAVSIGSRFSTPTGSDSVVFKVTSAYTDTDGNTVDGKYLLTAETAGTIGNDYTGVLTPITYISGLASAVLSDVITSGSAEEDDDALLARYLEEINYQAFGGNIEDYRKTILAIDGVGAVQVYPVWNGGGTVKCSIITTSYDVAADDLVETVQEEVDPVVGSGTGLGTAPIGHQVTITTPTAVDVDIDATLTLASGYSITQVQSAIETAVTAYILTVRKAWGTMQSTTENIYSVYVYRSQLIAAMVSVSGVLNINSLIINGAAVDLELTQNETIQQLPILGAITLGT